MAHTSQVSRVAHHTYIWWQVPIHTMGATSTRFGHRRRGLAVTPTQHPGRLSLSGSILLFSNCSITTLWWRDLVHTIKDALSHILQPHPVEVRHSGSSEASQQVPIEALPDLVLPLKRVLYDTAAGGMVKIGKPVQFSPELEIPFGMPQLLPWFA